MRLQIVLEGKDDSTKSMSYVFIISLIKKQNNNKQLLDHGLLSRV